MREPETAVDEEQLATLLLKTYKAARLAGIPAHEIEPVLLRRVRSALGMRPQQARTWFYPRLIRATPRGG